MDVAATFCATLVDEWCRAGVSDAAVTPGSRSTPLLLALRADERIRLHVFLDERSAAFFALGIGLASGRPAVVATTSGTAAAELLPAVTEAHHAGVPLIACTADRPPEAHGIGSPQTVDQSRLYDPALRWRTDPGVPDASMASSWRSLGARAVCETLGASGRPGPVHLNLAFREPLVGEAGPLPAGRPDGTPWHRSLRSGPPSSSTIAELTRLSSNRRGVIVAGAGSGDPDGVHELAGVLGWPVLADPRSNCRRPERTTVSAFDALLRHAPVAAELTPEVVLRAGAPPASKVLAAWLASTGADQVAVETYGSWLDPERTAHMVVEADPGAAFRAVARNRPTPCSRGWLETWAAAESTAQEALDGVLARHRAATEPGIARALVDCLPHETTLVVSSSMPIRDVEWYARPRQDVRVLANRGANGIDGVVSTVLGAAASRPGRPTAGLLGDLALLHDAGALLGAALRELNCVIVVVDNDGGGIFSFLPQASALPEDDFERLFATPHGLDLAGLARLHGLATSEVDRVDELDQAVQAGFKAAATTVIVVRTEQRSNVRVHDELHAAVAAALEGLGRRAG
ncbi:MAG TPA: 2-succinyl-5-enolpyruvyl-6-hydroxy-3-cyclohexene-1-carboxylic-acid synthase [Acidimicrobiales bacterium]